MSLPHQGEQILLPFFFNLKIVVPPLIFQYFCIFIYLFTSYKSTFHFYYHITDMVFVELFWDNGVILGKTGYLGMKLVFIPYHGGGQN